MDALFTMLKNVILFVALAVPGYLLVKGKLLNAAHFSGLVTPLSMTILGMKLAQIKFTSLFRSWRVCSLAKGSENTRKRKKPPNGGFFMRFRERRGIKAARCR